MFCRNTRSLWSQSRLSFLYPVKGGSGASHIYIQTITCCYPKKKVNFWHACLPVGVKWKVVRNVHCPSLLIDTGLMSIGPLTKKLLQKRRPVSYSKKRTKRALSPRSLTESSAVCELSWLDAHWDCLCGLMLITSSKNCEKKAVKHDQLCPFGSHTVKIFFGQVDLELLPFIAECVTNIEN